MKALLLVRCWFFVVESADAEQEVFGSQNPRKVLLGQRGFLGIAQKALSGVVNISRKAVNFGRNVNPCVAKWWPGQNLAELEKGVE
jgi:hypothetical protein